MENTTLNFGGGKRQRGGDWAGFFNSQAELDLWTQLNTNEVFVGLRATLPSGPVTWRGAGSGGWVDLANKWDDDALLVIGDSRVFAEGGLSVNGAKTARTYYYGACGPVAWAQSLLGDKRFRTTHLRGRSGMQAAIVAANSTAWGIDNLLASSNAKHVFVRLGTNDLNISSMNTAEQTYANLASIVDKITESGRIAHISTVEPRDLFGGYTTAHTIRGLKLNSLIKDEMPKKKDVYVVEIADAFTDWTVKANYLPIIAAGTSVVGDGLHTSVRGAYIAGIVLKNHFEAFRKPSKLFGGFHYLSTKANSPVGSVQLLTNPLMDAGVYPIGGTGITISTVTAPNGIGNAMRADVASTAVAGTATFANQVIDVSPGDLSAGKKIRAYARVKISGAGGIGAPVGLRSVALSFDLANVSGHKNGTQFWWDNVAGSYDASTSTEFSGELLLVTPEYTCNGSDSVSSPNFFMYARHIANPAYRIEVYDCGVFLDDAPVGPQWAQFWANDDTGTPIY